MRNRDEAGLDGLDLLYDWRSRFFQHSISADAFDFGQLSKLVCGDSRSTADAFVDYAAEYLAACWLLLFAFIIDTHLEQVLPRILSCRRMALFPLLLGSATTSQTFICPFAEASVDDLYQLPTIDFLDTDPNQTIICWGCLGDAS